jgi:hypothetical protein
MANFMVIVPSSACSLDISGQDGTRTVNVSNEIYFTRQTTPWDNISGEAISGITWPITNDSKSAIVSAMKDWLNTNHSHNLTGAFFMGDGSYVSALLL